MATTAWRSKERTTNFFNNLGRPLIKKSAKLRQLYVEYLNLCTTRVRLTESCEESIKGALEALYEYAPIFQDREFETFEKSMANYKRRARDYERASRKVVDDCTDPRLMPFLNALNELVDLIIEEDKNLMLQAEEEARLARESRVTRARALAERYPRHYNFHHNKFVIFLLILFVRKICESVAGLTEKVVVVPDVPLGPDSFQDRDRMLPRSIRNATAFLTYNYANGYAKPLLSFAANLMMKPITIFANDDGKYVTRAYDTSSSNSEQYYVGVEDDHPEIINGDVDEFVNALSLYNLNGEKQPFNTLRDPKLLRLHVQVEKLEEILAKIIGTSEKKKKAMKLSDVDNDKKKQQEISYALRMRIYGSAVRDMIKAAGGGPRGRGVNNTTPEMVALENNLRNYTGMKKLEYEYYSSPVLSTFGVGGKALNTGMIPTFVGESVGGVVGGVLGLSAKLADITETNLMDSGWNIGKAYGRRMSGRLMGLRPFPASKFPYSGSVKPKMFSMNDWAKSMEESVFEMASPNQQVRKMGSDRSKFLLNLMAEQIELESTAAEAELYSILKFAIDTSTDDPDDPNLDSDASVLENWQSDISSFIRSLFSAVALTFVFTDSNTRGLAINVATGAVNRITNIGGRIGGTIGGTIYGFITYRTLMVALGAAIAYNNYQ